MSVQYEILPPGGHETYATSIFSKIKTYLDSNPYKPVKGIPNTPIAIATFDDGSALPMPKLEVAIEPQQDLHGYDAPWVGGAGKNKFPIATASSSGAQNIFSSQAISLKANTNYILSFDTNNPTTKTMSVSFNAGSTQVRGIDIPAGTYIVGISFSQNVDNLNWYVREAVNISNIMIEEGGAKTDFAPYSNICPIIGWDEVNVTVCGNNLLASSTLVSNTYINQNTGEEIPYNGWTSTDYIPINTNKWYRLLKLVDSSYAVNAGATVYWACYDANLNFVRGSVGDGMKDFPSNAKWLRTSSQTALMNKAVLCEDSYVSSFVTESDYIDGAIYNVQFTDGDNPLTVYGGSLDVVSGELTVDRVFNTFTELPSQYADVGNDIVCAFIQSNNMKANSRNDGLSNYFFSTNTIIGQNNPWRVCFGINNKRIYFTFDPEVIGGNTLENINNYVAINPIQVVYPLATPLTIQLTSTQVKSLLGQNNIWADTGDVLDGEYIRDKYDNMTAKYASYAYNSGNATTASKLGSSNIGSATQPIYLNGGTATACTYTLGKSVPSDAVFTDTKNTAGSTDTSSKIFLIGATSQAANPQTYSQDTAYVGTDGCLYSGGSKVLTTHQSVTDNNPTLSWGTKSKVATIGGTAINVTMPSNPNTDVNVKQTPVTNQTGAYRILFSRSADDTEHTEGVYKFSGLTYDPDPSLPEFIFSKKMSDSEDTESPHMRLRILDSQGIINEELSITSNNIFNQQGWGGDVTVKSLNLALSNKVDRAGDTMSGTLNFSGSDICLKTSSSSSNDSGDIVFYYGNGNEKSRIWTDTEYTATMGPNYRVYKEDGTSLYSGRLATLSDLSWGNISGKPSSFTPAAHNHTQLNDRGNVTAEAGANRPAVAVLSLVREYNNGYPATYGNVITLNGSGCGEIFIGWSGSSGQHAPCYVRSKRDTSDASWSGWSKIFTASYPPTAVECGALPTTGGTLTGQLTITKGRLQLGSSAGTIICSTALISRHDTGDGGYINHVNYNNNAYAPIRASAFTTMSCKHTKTNVIDISEEDALKLLDVRPVNFDYIEEVGGLKDQIGVLAEDTYDVLPKVVSVPDDYVEEDFDISKGIQQPLPSVDYAKFVPYLIKMVQIQQKEIDELKTSLRALV